MFINWKDWNWLLALGSLLIIDGAISTSINCTLAQPIPDDTLGTESSIVKRSIIPLENNGASDVSSILIDGGAERGANLLHSFKEFNIEEKVGVYFNIRNRPEIKNILSRVTGNKPSEILGNLGVLGNANLFLINPNGIIFGSNARLILNGSFMGTTANAIRLANGEIFSANPLENLPSGLLNVNPSALLFNQMAAEIQNNSVNLSVDDNYSLLLIGGDVRMDGSSLNALGGRVELGGLAQEGTVDLDIRGDDFKLDFPANIARADVLLTNGAEVNVASGGGGNIAIHAQNINILERSSLSAGIALLEGAENAQAGDIMLSAKGTLKINNSSVYNAVLGSGNGGNLLVSTGKLIIEDGIVATATIFDGSAGNLVVNASDSIELTGSSSPNGAIDINVPVQLGSNFTRTIPFTVPIGLVSASLNVKNLLSQSFRDELRNFLPFDTIGSGKAGNLTIKAAGQLSISDGAIVSADTTSRGQGGNLTVSADLIKLSGTSSENSSLSMFRTTKKLPSSLRNGTDGLGSGGNLTIGTRQLTIRDGAWVITGAGNKTPENGKTVNGGKLTVNASEFVELSGTSPDNIPSVLASATQGVGNAGKLTITTKKLMVSNGGIISTGTSSSGQGGDLIINATDSIKLVGTSKQGASKDQIEKFLGAGGASVSYFIENRPFPSGVISGTTNTGNAGNLTITTGQLLIEDGAQASVSTINAGDAGDLQVNASSIQLRKASLENPKPNDVIGRSLLTTAVSEGATGKGGNITIEANSLTITDGAALATSSSGQGSAGNLTVKPIVNTNLTIYLNNGGKITADTTGGGGNIDLKSSLVLLGNQSSITTNAQGPNIPGGNIHIDTDLLIGFENSDIRADSTDFRGGTVGIKASGILGIKRRDVASNSTSDITAKGRSPELSGTVEINTPDIDPAQGLAELPTEIVDVSRLIGQDFCRVVGQNSEFVVTGRGGLPTSPNETLRANTPWEDLRLVEESELEPPQLPPTSRSEQPKMKDNQPQTIVEAQGWITSSNGNVLLTAKPVTVTPQGLWLHPLDCQWWKQTSRS